MSVPIRLEPRQRNATANKWGTIRYALGSNARTVRLCMIMFAASIPPGLLALLFRR